MSGSSLRELKMTMSIIMISILMKSMLLRMLCYIDACNMQIWVPIRHVNPRILLPSSSIFSCSHRPARRERVTHQAWTHTRHVHQPMSGPKQRENKSMSMTYNFTEVLVGAQLFAEIEKPWPIKPAVMIWKHQQLSCHLAAKWHPWACEWCVYAFQQSHSTSGAVASIVDRFDLSLEWLSQFMSEQSHRNLLQNIDQPTNGN